MDSTEYFESSHIYLRLSQITVLQDALLRIAAHEVAMLLNMYAVNLKRSEKTASYP
jgi:hypothetical protein